MLSEGLLFSCTLANQPDAKCFLCNAEICSNYLTNSKNTYKIQSVCFRDKLVQRVWKSEVILRRVHSKKTMFHVKGVPVFSLAVHYPTLKNARASERKT